MVNDLTVVPPIEQRLEKLSADEHLAYDRYVRANKPGLAPDYSQRLYELFVRGLDCTAITLLNPGLTLGVVAKARVEGLWDQRRDEYTASLLTTTNDLLRQTAAESLQFLSLLLSVAHKKYGEQLKKYLSSGNPDDLGEFQVVTLKQYQSTIETIAKLVGADQKKTVTHRIVPSDSEKGSDAGGVLGALGGGRLTPEQADAVRAVLEKGR